MQASPVDRGNLHRFLLTLTHPEQQGRHDQEPRAPEDVAGEVGQACSRAERDDASGLREVLEEARTTQNVEVQVCALDALSRLAAESGDLDDARARLAESDGLAAQVAHVLDESDRFDAIAVRTLR